ncbi:MAG: heme-binding protein [Pirellulaceae bacterium]|nr:heme-binding protein [Pirellulaceae bacterium]
MFGSPFYIPEAKQPEGFPPPGKVNEIVIKEYPVYRSATVKSSAAGQNRLFGTLFNHIKNNKIAMTAPVEMSFDDEKSQSMAFLYASTDIGDTGVEGKVLVADQEPTTVISIAVRGSYNEQRLRKYEEKLRDWVDKKPEWKTTGVARYLGFNSPFVPSFMRYGEVQIPITKRSE